VRRFYFVSLRRASCAALLVTASALRAQSSAVVDEGTFTVSKKGAPLGRESFRIKREVGPGGQVFQATGESALGDTRLTTRLGTDSTGVPVAYETEIKDRGEIVQTIQGRGRPGRFSVLMRTRSGESAREYMLNNGALLMDDDVFHHFFFVPLAAAHPELIVIAPREMQQSRFRVEQRGGDTIDIGGHAIECRHFALITPDGGTQDVWVDGKGRLVKVSIPEKALVALRDDPPR
jgi:hypothetical protein